MTHLESVMRSQYEEFSRRIKGKTKRIHGIEKTLVEIKREVHINEIYLKELEDAADKLGFSFEDTPVSEN